MTATQEQAANVEYVQNAIEAIDSASVTIDMYPTKQPQFW